MRQYVLFILACVCALAGALGARADDDPAPVPTTRAATTTAAPREPDVIDREVLKAIARYRRATWHWQRVMGQPVTRKLRNAPRKLEDRLPVWRRVAKRTWTRAQHPPHARAWSCIHRFEGSWADPYAPYYGGLQMDIGFQRTYGAYLLRKKGTANHWTPLEQMWVAERAHRSGRGFYPWPNTARYCGLI